MAILKKMRIQMLSGTPGMYIYIYMYVYKRSWFLSDEGPMLKTLDYTIRVGGTPTILYFDLYKRSVLRSQSRDTNRNIKWSMYCQYG